MTNPNLQYLSDNGYWNLHAWMQLHPTLRAFYLTSIGLPHWPLALSLYHATFGYSDPLSAYTQHVRMTTSLRHVRIICYKANIEIYEHS